MGSSSSQPLSPASTQTIEEGKEREDSIKLTASLLCRSAEQPVSAGSTIDTASQLNNPIQSHSQDPGIWIGSDQSYQAPGRAEVSSYRSEKHKEEDATSFEAKEETGKFSEYKEPIPIFNERISNSERANVMGKRNKDKRKRNDGTDETHRQYHNHGRVDDISEISRSRSIDSSVLFSDEQRIHDTPTQGSKKRRGRPSADEGSARRKKRKRRSSDKSSNELTSSLNASMMAPNEQQQQGRILQYSGGHIKNETMDTSSDLVGDSSKQRLVGQSNHDSLQQRQETPEPVFEAKLPKDTLRTLPASKDIRPDITYPALNIVTEKDSDVTDSEDDSCSPFEALNDASRPKGLVNHTKDNAPNQQKPKTISELTNFNEQSQKFKSAKIKHYQGQNDGNTNQLNDPVSIHNSKAIAKDSDKLLKQAESDKDALSQIGHHNDIRNERHVQSDDDSPMQSSDSESVVEVSKNHNSAHAESSDDDYMTGEDVPISSKANQVQLDNESASQTDDTEDADSSSLRKPTDTPSQEKQPSQNDGSINKQTPGESTESTQHVRQFLDERSENTSKINATTKHRALSSELGSSPNKATRKRRPITSTELIHEDETDSNASEAEGDDDVEEGQAARVSSISKPKTPRRLPVKQIGDDRPSKKMRKSENKNNRRTSSRALGPQLTGKPERSGPFDEDEILAIESFKANFPDGSRRAEHDFVKLLHENAHNNPLVSKFWSEIIETLPTHRDRKSVQRFCRRHWPIAEMVREKFSKAEDQRLVRLVSIHGQKWVKIGEEIGRPAEMVRDRYRNVLKDKATRNTTKWSHEEISKLKEVMGEIAYAAYQVNRGTQDVDSLIQWASVSEKMGGIRGRAQCAYKWKLLKSKGEVSLKREMLAASRRTDPNGTVAPDELEEISRVFDKRIVMQDLDEEDSDPLETSLIRDDDSSHSSSSKDRTKTGKKNSQTATGRSPTNSTNLGSKKHRKLKDKTVFAAESLSSRTTSREETEGSESDHSIFGADDNTETTVKIKAGKQSSYPVTSEKFPVVYSSLPQEQSDSHDSLVESSESDEEVDGSAPLANQADKYHSLAPKIKREHESSIGGLNGLTEHNTEDETSSEDESDDIASTSSDSDSSSGSVGKTFIDSQATETSKDEDEEDDSQEEEASEEDTSEDEERD